MAELSVTFVAFQVFEDVGIEDRGADFIDAHGPFAEVDAAAAVTAEGEVFVGSEDQFLAGGAVKRLDLRGFGGFGHRE